MLEKVPHGIGHALRGIRAGMSEVVYNGDGLAAVRATIAVTSSAFGNGQAIPAPYTADGQGISPPLAWRNIPLGTESIVVIIEDPDAPVPDPLVHLIVWDLPGREMALAAGDLPSKQGGGMARFRLGRNSFLKAEYLAPDPPRGHGPHRYAFQVFALDSRLSFGDAPSRRRLVGAMRDHVLGKGWLIGVYGRP